MRIGLLLLLVLPLALVGCYNAPDAAEDANSFCKPRGGVAAVNYTRFGEQATWTCKDGTAGGHDG